MSLRSCLPRSVVDLVEALSRCEAICVHPHSSYENTDSCEEHTSKVLEKHEMNAMPKERSFVVASRAPNDTAHT
jgi:hypothetical protein